MEGMIKSIGLWDDLKEYELRNLEFNCLYGCYYKYYNCIIRIN